MISLHGSLYYTQFNQHSQIMIPIESRGLYFPQMDWIQNPKPNSWFMAYLNSTRRRFFSPGGSPVAFVVSYYGPMDYYSHKIYLNSQYIYGNIYDAMRQVLAYREDNQGLIELFLYTDECNLESIRTWNYVENCDYCGWIKK